MASEDLRLMGDYFAYAGRIALPDVYPLFVGHEGPRVGGQWSKLGQSGICSFGNPSLATWIQYPGDPQSNAAYPSWFYRLQKVTGVYGDCFHPNKQGAEAYATTVFNSAMVLLNPMLVH